MRIRHNARRRARLLGMVLAPVLVVGAVGSATAVHSDKNPNPVGDLLGNLLHSPNNGNQPPNNPGPSFPKGPNQPGHNNKTFPKSPNQPGPNDPGPNDSDGYYPYDPDNGSTDPGDDYVPHHKNGGTGGGGGVPDPGDGPYDGGYDGDPGDRGGFYDPRDNDNFPGMHTDECLPGSMCVVRIVGDSDVFRVSANGGDRRAVLTARLNGGPPPQCGRFDEGDSDWVQFHFANADAGRSWTKTVSMDDNTRFRSLAAARRSLSKDAVCFAAPYFFVPAQGYPLTRSGGSYNGVLPDCADLKFATVNGHSAGKRPCVVDQQIRRDRDGYFIRDIIRVPAGPEDPRTRHHER